MLCARTLTAWHEHAELHARHHHYHHHRLSHRLHTKSRTKESFDYTYTYSYTNTHNTIQEFEPKALHVQPGSGDRTSTHPISIFHPSLFPPRITPTTTTTTTITTTHLPTNIPPPNEKVCFITHDPIAQVRHRLISAGIEIVDLSPEKTEEDGTVFRTGARGRLRSVYCRDPDGNLVE